MIFLLSFFLFFFFCSESVRTLQADLLGLLYNVSDVKTQDNFIGLPYFVSDAKS